MGAVFNRDYPVNRGWPATSSVESKPLPPTVNYSLNDIEFYVVSHEKFGSQRFFLANLAAIMVGTAHPTFRQVVLRAP